MKWFVCIALLAIGFADAEQNAAFRERAEIYSSNVLLFEFYFFNNLQIHRLNYSITQTTHGMNLP